MHSLSRMAQLRAEEAASAFLLRSLSHDNATTAAAATTATTTTTTPTSSITTTTTTNGRSIVVNPIPTVVPAVAVPDRRVAISKHLEYPGDPAALERMVANSSEFNINGKDMFGLTALHKLSSWDKPDLLATLLNGSERVDARSVTAGDGFTCLHCAVNMRALTSLEWLLRALPEEVHQYLG